MTDTEKTTELCNLMDVLCDVNFPKRAETIDQWIHTLGEVYSDGYRHAYSEISFKLQNIISESISKSSDSDTEVLETLGENLNVLDDQISTLVDQNDGNSFYTDLISGYRKFADHIKLEIGRYNFIKLKIVGSLSVSQSHEHHTTDQDFDNCNKIAQLEKDVNRMRPTIVDAQKQLNGLDDKLENNKISSITTLTIFSAVILTFFGGITFESGIFNGMTQSSPYRLVFTIALSGLILFNTIFALLYLVGKMVGKRIGTKCKYLVIDPIDCHKCQSCGEGYCGKDCPEASFGCRVLHKYCYVFAIDATLVYILYSDFFLWLCNGEISDYRFLCAQCFEAFLPVVVAVTHMIRRYARLKRIRLHYKIAIMQDVLEPQISTSIIKTLQDFQRSLYGSSKKDPKDSFLEKIKAMDQECAIKYLDEYADEYVCDNSRLAIFVTKHEHKINKKKFKEIRQNFLDYLKNNP